MRLQSKGVNVGSGCYLCQSDEESMVHLLMECQFMNQIVHVAGLLEHLLVIQGE